MARVSFSFTVEKADENGYHGVLQVGEHQRTVCRTTLPEIVGWLADHSGAIFKESPYLPPAPQPYKQAPVPNGNGADEQADHELVDKIAERFSFNTGNGNARASVVAFLFCTALSLNLMAQRLLA